MLILKCCFSWVLVCGVGYVLIHTKGEGGVGFGNIE